MRRTTDAGRISAISSPSVRVVLRVALLVALVVALVLAGPASATFPGRNGLISVDTFRAEATQSWVVRPDGSGLTRLPVAGFSAFSPDGHSVALADGRTLAVTDLNGGNRRVVLKGGKLY